MLEFDIEKTTVKMEEQILNSLFNWLVQYAYFYGSIQAAQSMQDSDDGALRFGDITPRFNRLKFGWRRWYGSIELFIRDEHLTSYPHGWGIDKFDVFGRGDAGMFDRPRLVNEINIAVVRFFPGIKQISNYCPCEICSQGWLCEYISGRWLCDDCQDKYLLVEDLSPYGATKKEKDERAKMTKSLRFEILERDDFTCQLCGRSPLKGDDIKLHVDHKHPIAKGGKTERDNLHVLCEDCNLGKGTKIVDQLDMFDCA